jgi:hypothetical protein
MQKLRLNERQKKGMVQLRTAGRITNADYQRVSGATPKTSMRDLAALVERAVLERIGTRKGAYYRLAKQWDINGTFGTRAGTSSEKSPDQKRSDDMRQLWDKRDSRGERAKGDKKGTSGARIRQGAAEDLRRIQQPQRRTRQKANPNPTAEETKRKKRNGKRSKRT